MRIGALGTFDFPRGHYVYIGSALNGLEARIARHLAGVPWQNLSPDLQSGEIGKRCREIHQKKMFWHIDYFL